MPHYVVVCPVCRNAEPGAVCIKCEGEGFVSLSEGDARDVLAFVRGHPILEAADPESDEPISGCDAVDALCELRAILDAALE